MAPGSPPDPASMLQSAVDLLSPAEAAKQLPWLVGELAKITLVSPTSNSTRRTPGSRIRLWTANPAYLVARLVIPGVEDGLAGWPTPWAPRGRGRRGPPTWPNIMTASLAPTNFLPTNPAALKRAFETGGLSLVSGAQNMLRDLASGGMPSMVNWDVLKVGEQLACTPGSIVYRDGHVELIQYAPSTPGGSAAGPTADGAARLRMTCSTSRRGAAWPSTRSRTVSRPSW